MFCRSWGSNPKTHCSRKTPTSVKRFLLPCIIPSPAAISSYCLAPPEFTWCLALLPSLSPILCSHCSSCSSCRDAVFQHRIPFGSWCCLGGATVVGMFLLRYSCWPCLSPFVFTASWCCTFGGGRVLVVWQSIFLFFFFLCCCCLLLLLLLSILMLLMRMMIHHGCFLCSLLVPSLTLGLHNSIGLIFKVLIFAWLWFI